MGIIYMIALVNDRYVSTFQISSAVLSYIHVLINTLISFVGFKY